MAIMKFCQYFILFVALALGGLRYLGTTLAPLKGASPFFLSEINIKESTIPDLTNKLFVVTGANVGLGKSTAKHLAANGGKVILGCRSLKKCNAAKEEIISEIGTTSKKFKQDNLIPMELDLSSFKSIKSFADAFTKKYSQLNSLILNAGVMHCPFSLTEDGLENQIGVNHFGHFLLTKLLLPLLEKSQPSTIVSVSSNGHFGSYEEGIKLRLEDMNDEKQYNSIRAYGQSKLANVLFAQELAERFTKEGKRIYVNSMNPGAVNTDLLRHHPQWLQDAAKWFFQTFPNTLFFESDYAALTEVYLAVGEDIMKNKVTGKYFVPIGEMCDTATQAKDMKLQKGLWSLSEKVLKNKGY